MQVDSDVADQTQVEADAIYKAWAELDIHDIRLLKRISELLPEVRAITGDSDIMEPIQWRAQHAMGAILDRISRICSRDIPETGD